MESEVGIGALHGPSPPVERPFSIQLGWGSIPAHDSDFLSIDPLLRRLLGSPLAHAHQRNRGPEEFPSEPGRCAPLEVLPLEEAPAPGDFVSGGAFVGPGMERSNRAPHGEAPMEYR